MDNSTFAALGQIQRPHGPLTLPGGSRVNVRSLTLGELRKLDSDAQLEPEEGRGEWHVLVLVARGLCDEKGTPAMGYPTRADLDALADVFTQEQLRAIAKAAAGNRDEAKNG